MVETDIRPLLDLAVEMGATEAVVVDPSGIVVRDELAAMCEKPRCASWGLSPHCPPHVAGPAAMREHIRESTRAVVFRIDVPTELLLGEMPAEILGLVQEIAARIEERAVDLGVPRARGFAGGSCFHLFCHQEGDCPPLDGTGPCRYPQRARPSMSGFGVDVGRLVALAGWKMNRVDSSTDPTLQPTSPLVGLVLLTDAE